MAAPNVPPIPPGTLELWVLLAVVRLGERACATTVAEHLAERTGLADARGHADEVLAELLRAGRLARAGPPDNTLGVQRSRVFYRVTVHGRRDLRLALAATDALRAGLPGLTASG